MTSDDVLVWIAGTSWDAPVPGTDRRLAVEVAKEIPVLWVDPPVPWRPEHGTTVYRMSLGAEGLTRLTITAPPGVTRPGIRRLTSALLGRAVRGALADLGRTPSAVLSAFPLAVFPAGVAGTRLLYVTDDWLGGSPQLGFSTAAVRRTLTHNLRAADVVAAVSPVLAADLDALGRGRDHAGPPARVLPNGCPQYQRAASPAPRTATAGVVGTLNERLDLDVLEAVRDTGVELRLVGPRVETTRACRLRLEALLRATNVSWCGPLPAARVRAELDTLGVGLTPYADTAFNRASFPLKTLEYLASGLGVVSTDLPAVRWLASDLIAVGGDPVTFAGLVTTALDHRHDRGLEQRRQEFAAEHSWENRASELVGMITAAAVGGGTTGRQRS